MPSPDASDEIHDGWQRMIVALSTLGVHAGIMSAVVPNMPLYAQENFVSKMHEITAWAAKQTDEIHDFGESFDEDAPQD
jgi:hypothetical protein